MKRAVAGVIEDLGSEIMVACTIDVPYVEHASPAQAAEASADEDEASATLVRRQVAMYAPGLRTSCSPALAHAPLAPTATSP